MEIETAKELKLIRIQNEQTNEIQSDCFEQINRHRADTKKSKQRMYVSENFRERLID